MAISANYYNRLYNMQSSSILLNNYNSSFSGVRNTSSYSPMQSMTQLLGYNYASTVDSGAQSYLTGLKGSAEKLNDLVSTLQGETKSKQDTVVSSDTASVSVSSTAYSTKIDDVKMNVEQAASGQVNRGEELSSDRKIYSSQTYKFEIEAEGKKHQISFSVSSGDTYEDMQKKMAKAINDKNIGVKASVSNDFDNKKSSLVIEAKNTGDDDKNRFSIKDISGDAVRKTGTGSMTQDAQNAIYSINGGEKIESKSNKVDLGKGVTATIKKATDGDVTIGMGKEKTVTYENVEELVKQFNNFLGNVSENKSDSGANKLMQRLSGLTKSYSSALKRVGININSEGYMSIDKKKLNASIEDGSVEKLFTDNKNGSYGFANRLSRITEDVTKNPTSYISKEALGSYFSNDNPSLNYLQSYRYNQISNTGLLFDMFL